MGRVEVERTVEQRFFRASLHVEFAGRLSLQCHVRAHHETVEQVEREIVELGIAFKNAPVAVKVSAVASQHLLVVRADEGRGVVFAARFGQVERFDAHIAQRYILITEIFRLYRSHGRELFVQCVVRYVDVAAQDARNPWQVR